MLALIGEATKRSVVRKEELIKNEEIEETPDYPKR
jgi:hypothetical protein